MTSTRRMSRTTAIVTLGLIVLVATAGCKALASRRPTARAKKVTIAVSPWPASASVYVAKEKGHFGREGLDASLRSYPSGHLALAAMLSGKADFATVSETPIARAVLDRKPFVVAATISRIDRGVLIIARRDRGISRAEDLKGKKVGVVAGTAADFFLDIYLTTSYVDPRQVRIVHLGTEKVVDALLSGKVDAVSTWAPQTTTLESRMASGAVALDQPGLYAMTWNVVAAKGMAVRDPDVIARFLRAMVRANRFIAEQPASARAITARNIHMAAPELAEEWANYHATAELDQSLILYLEDQARWMIDKGLVRGDVPDYRAYVYTKGLRGIRPEMVTVPE